MKKTLLLIVIFSFVLIFLNADEDHYINIFIGDRAAGLGGAYTAIADGPEGAYYNPAGLAFSGAKYFSLSANAVQYKQLTYRDIWPSALEPIDYNRFSISFIPNFFGFLQKAKNMTFAVTISVPDSEFFDQRDRFNLPFDSTGDTRANINLNLIDMVYEVGPSFAFLPHKRVAVGFGVFLKYRDKKLIYNQTYHIEGYNTFSTSNIYYSERILGLKLQAGVQVMPVDFLSIGYNVIVPLDFLGIYNLQKTTFVYYDEEYRGGFNLERYPIDHLPGYNFTNNFEIQDNKLTVKNMFTDPLFKPIFIKQALGVAFFISKSFLVSVDGYLYIPITKYLVENGEYSSYVITWNIAAGIEWFITQNFPLRLGFFTNNTNRPIIDEDDPKINQDDWVNLYGGSFTIGYSTSDFTINFGGTFSYGRGKAQILSNTYAIQALDAFSMNIFISGGYLF